MFLINKLMNISIYKLISVFIFITLVFTCTHAYSAQRALLVGVGEYQIPNKNLPGIDIDLELMKDALIRLGFAEDEIKVLYNKNATYKNIRDAATTWLVKGVKKEDRVVIYFGGHGSRIHDEGGDEEDHVDEVLLPHDAQYLKLKTGRTLTNVVVDDDFASWLANIPSNNILVLVDACNSGTVTRSVRLSNLSLGVDTAIAKFFHYNEIPDSSGSTFTRSLAIRGLNQNNNYIAISAAQDTELALATERGSYFTLGITDAIHQASKDKYSITVEELHQFADQFIDKMVSEKQRYHPQIHGNEKLAKGEFKLFKFTQGHGPKWKSLEKLSNRGRLLDLSLDKKEYFLNDNVLINVNVPENGYLNIISIDAYDHATVLFPNKYNLDNYVKRSAVLIPNKDMPFTLPAVEPTGPTMVAAFLSTTPINLYEHSHEGRDIDGALHQTFATLSYSGIRAIVLESNKSKQNVNNTLYGHAVYTNIINK